MAKRPVSPEPLHHPLAGGSASNPRPLEPRIEYAVVDATAVGTEDLQKLLTLRAKEGWTLNFIFHSRLVFVKESQ